VSTPRSAARATTGSPTIGRVRPAFVAQAVLVGAAVVIYTLVLSQGARNHQDFGVYLNAARDILHGQPLYAAFLHHPFPDATLRPAYIYPPSFALLVAALGPFPDSAAAAVWMTIEQASLAVAVVVVLRWLRPAGWAVTAVLVATLTFYPLWVDVVQGQANLLVLMLVTVGVVGILKGRPTAGAAIGAAAALKLTPLILVIWLVLDRRFRAAAFLLGGFAIVTAAGALLRFQDTLAYFGQVLPALASGTAFYANQSLAGVFDRTLSANPYTRPWIAVPWISMLLIAVAGALIFWWWWQTRRQPAEARAAAFIPLLPLLSSVTWTHHLVIVLPAIWISIIALARRDWPLLPTAALAGVLVLFSIFSRWSPGPAFGQSGFRVAQTMDPGVFLTANALFFATVILFLGAPWLLRSRSPGRRRRPRRDLGASASRWCSRPRSPRSHFSPTCSPTSGPRRVITSPVSSSSPTMPPPTWPKCGRAPTARGSGAIPTPANPTAVSCCLASTSCLATWRRCCICR
jgi:alpha-1,2-mannosyltransferase